MLVLALALAALAAADAAPLPEGSAVLVAHSTLTSEDGRHTVQLATFGFPLSKPDAGLLVRVMNSDPYWHHFRGRQVYLQVGGKAYPGGPRLVTHHPWADLLGKKDGPRPKYGWTTSFALPADVKLAGELAFSYDTGARSVADPGKPFARLELTEQDVKAAAVPLRATVRLAGRSDDGHFAVVALNHLPWYADVRLGEAEAGHASSVSLGEGKGHRHVEPDEYILTFKDAPSAGAVVRVKFREAEGWYKAETAAEKPKEKK